MTDAEIDELYERSKDDRVFIAGSEVRHVIGLLRSYKQAVERTETMLEERLALSERLIGPMGAVPYVIPIQDVQETLKR